MAKTINAIYINARFLAQISTGVQIYAREVCRHLGNDSNLQFILLAPSGASFDAGLSHLECVRVGQAAGYVWEQLELYNYLKKRGNPLLINFCNTAPLFYKNQVVTIHDLAFAHHPEWFSKSFAHVYRWMIPRIVKRAKHVVTVSQTIKKQLEETYRVSSKKIAVIGNGLQADILNSPVWGTKEKLIFTVSSINPRKNLQTLIKVFEQAKLQDYKLVISGAANSVFAGAHFPVGNAQIEWVGYLDNDRLIDHYRKAEIFVSLSHDEGFGIPVLEAAHFNCKILLSDIPAYRELFADVAHFTNQNSIDACAAALVQLSKSRMDSHQTAYKRLLERHTYSQSASLLNRLVTRELFGK